MDSSAERRALESIAINSPYAKGPNGAMIRYCTGLWSRYWRGGTCLELGPAEGLMTDSVVRHFEKVVAVDGSAAFCAQLQRAIPEVEVHCSLFELYEPDAKFDAILLGHILEHVERPVDLLRRVGQWLSDSGKLFVAVPNSRSLHRQAAVVMGLLRSESELNDTDVRQGHRRVYSPEALRSDVLQAGLNIDVFGGFWLKPLSNVQLEEQWTTEMIDAYMVLGERYPDVAAEIFVIASAIKMPS